MTPKEEFQSELNSMKPSERAVVVNFFQTCDKHKGFEEVFEVWSQENEGYSVSEFFLFLDDYEASAMCGYIGMSSGALLS